MQNQRNKNFESNTELDGSAQTDQHQEESLSSLKLSSIPVTGNRAASLRVPRM